MTSSKDLFEQEREQMDNPAPALKHKQSIFKIRQDHMSLLAEIEENDGELSEDMLSALRLNEEDFKNKAISYAYVIKKMDAESDVIATEIKRLQSLKSKADKKSDLFRKLIDEGMQQFGYDKVESETLKISYRKTSPVELKDNFADNILQYVKVDFQINPELSEKASEAGITEEVIAIFNVTATANKEKIKEQLKAGVKIPGASIEEKKNIQIK